MSRPPVHEVAHIINSVKSQLPGLVNSTWKQRTLYALSRCRTAAMGGHIDWCDNPKCNKLHVSYNSCRNRHCPKCQGHRREKWIRDREAELLNVPYYHVVFTLPDHLNALCLHKPKLLYTMLFKTAWAVIKGFGENPKFLGATTGMITVLCRPEVSMLRVIGRLLKAKVSTCFLSKLCRRSFGLSFSMG